MNSEEIRKLPVPGATGNVFDALKPEYSNGLILREIAAQLADLNENIRAKSLTAECEAHVHISGGDYRDTGAGLP